MSSRNGVKLLAIVASIGMIAAIAAGLGALGSPKHQRALQLDSRRVTDLSRISMQISAYWSQHKSLPPDLAAIDTTRSQVSDPISGVPYEYGVVDSETYRLCGNFDAATEPEGGSVGGFSASGFGLRWRHPAGKHCFNLSAKYGVVGAY
jgi:hypothetical protein